MAEDRTEAPSRQRRQQARDRGQAAHSPELTGAAGLFAAAIGLSLCGDQLATSLIALVRDPFLAAPVVSANAAEVVARLRQAALGMLWPFIGVISAFTAAALAAHQLQVRGLWAPGLLAPDPGRLWAAGSAPGIASRATRGLWALAKCVVVAVTAAWVIQANWHSFQWLEDANVLALTSARVVRHLALALSAATFGLGLVDFWLQHRRFEAMLRTTPEEHREDLRSMEGDPALRARRRRIARSWRGDSSDLLVGASLVLTGPRGLTVVLGGGPPPRRVSVRSIVWGTAGDRLRHGAESAGVSVVSAPALALRLARRKPPTLPPTPELLEDLASLWATGT
jgi:flagellar biosynthetic protein FlhB